MNELGAGWRFRTCREGLRTRGALGINIQSSLDRRRRTGLGTTGLIFTHSRYWLSYYMCAGRKISRTAPTTALWLIAVRVGSRKALDWTLWGWMEIVWLEREI